MPKGHDKNRRQRQWTVGTKLSAIVIAVLASLMAPALLANNALPESVTLTTHNLFPYGSYQEDGQFKGIAVDRILCALNRLDVSLNLEVVPWARAEAEVLQGTVDGFFAASQNDVRDQHGVKSVQIADQTWQWFLLADNPWSPDRPGFNERALVTSFVGANMQTYLEENNYRLAPPPVTTEALATMLVSGRIDAALANNLVMNAILNEDYPDARIRTYVLKDKPLYAYFGNQFVETHPAFLPTFNRAIEACQFGLSTSGR